MPARGRRPARRYRRRARGQSRLCRRRAPQRPPPVHPRPPAPAGGDPRRPRPGARRRPRRGRRFVEQEAENAATNGTVIGPDRTAYTLPAEASGRKAVKLTPGQYVEFTLPSAANAITVRYSIPDAPGGGGITAPLDVTVNGGTSSDDDAHLAVRVAVQPVPVLQRPERRPAAPRLVDHRVRAACPAPPRRRRRSPSRSGRTTSTTSSGCCSAGRTRPATRSG